MHRGTSKCLNVYKLWPYPSLGYPCLFHQTLDTSTVLLVCCFKTGVREGVGYTGSCPEVTLLPDRSLAAPLPSQRMRKKNLPPVLQWIAPASFSLDAFCWTESGIQNGQVKEKRQEFLPPLGPISEKIFCANDRVVLQQFWPCRGHFGSHTEPPRPDLRCTVHVHPEMEAGWSSQTMVS